MDVNGFIFLIKVACETECQGDVVAALKKESISLNALHHAFSKHSSWLDLSDEDSNLVKLLRAVCNHEDG